MRVNGRQISYGATLARPMSEREARIYLDARGGQTIGMVAIALSQGAVPERLDTDAYVQDIGIKEAIVALRLAANRLEVLHNLVPMPEPSVTPENHVAAFFLAERLVDYCRSARVGAVNIAHMFEHARPTAVKAVAEALIRGVK